MMPDYQAMYLLLLRETEKALRLLIVAQQRCEDVYLEEDPPPLRFVLPEEEES